MVTEGIRRRSSVGTWMVWATHGEDNFRSLNRAKGMFDTTRKCNGRTGEIGGEEMGVRTTVGRFAGM